MLQFIIATILLFLPGIIAEAYYLRLRKININKTYSTIRSLGFSMVILMFRCFVSISKGYSDFPIQDLFSGIGNVAKYILLAGVLVVLLPNIFLIVPSVLDKISGKIVEGESHEDEKR